MFWILLFCMLCSNLGQSFNFFLLVYLSGLSRVRQLFKDDQNFVIDHISVQDEYLNTYTRIELQKKKTYPHYPHEYITLRLNVSPPYLDV